MSQRAVEAVIGQLICDERFRQEFYKDPKEATLRRGLQLTPVELSSLRSLKLRAVEKMSQKLDERIRRTKGPLKG